MQAYIKYPYVLELTEQCQIIYVFINLISFFFSFE